MKFLCTARSLNRKQKLLCLTRILVLNQTRLDVIGLASNIYSYHKFSLGGFEDVARLLGGFYWPEKSSKVSLWDFFCHVIWLCHEWLARQITSLIS